MSDPAHQPDMATSRPLGSLIVAMAQNGVIGRQGTIPWHLSTDLRRFRQLTMGHPMIMGRKTFESIGRPLPGRTSIVLTRQSDFQPEGVTVVAEWEEGLAEVAGETEFFVIGGGDVYRLALPRIDRIYLTRVAAEVSGDVTFPELDWGDWQLVEESWHDADDRNTWPHTFQIWRRKQSEPSRQNTRVS
jgi:dihydrofolate reductase